MKRFVLFFSLFSLPLAASPLIVSEDSSYNLSPYLEYFETPNPLPTAEAMHANYKRNTKEYFERKNISNEVWFRFEIENRGYSRNYFLSLNDPILDYAELYLPDEEGEYKVQYAGDTIPFNKWSEPYSHPVFRIFLNQGEKKRFYLHIKTASESTFFFEILETETLTRRELLLNLLHGFNFLITLIHIGVVSFLYARTRNRHYLILIPLAIFSFLYILRYSGSSYYFWPEFPFWQNNLPRFLICITIIIYLEFTRTILDLKTRNTFLNRFTLGLMFLGLIALVIFELKSKIFVAIHIGVSCIFIFLSVVYYYKKGLTYLRYFLWFLAIWASLVMFRLLMYADIIMPFPGYRNVTISLYSLTIYIFLKIAYELFRDARREKIKLEVSYLELLKKLEPPPQKSRISFVDTEVVISKIKEIIESEKIFQDEIFTLAKMAQFLKIRPDQLSEILNQKMNTNFNQFINTIRIHKACEMISESPEKNITEILFASGFNSKTSFNRAFSNIMSMSPTQYREKIAPE